jgi:plastocyanin
MVTWFGDFEAHPIRGGIVGNTTQSGPLSGTLSSSSPLIEIIFTTAGVYPYFCPLHPQMVGTIYVDAQVRVARYRTNLNN